MPTLLPFVVRTAMICDTCRALRVRGWGTPGLGVLDFAVAGFGGTALEFLRLSDARRRFHLLYRCKARPMQSTMRDFDPRRGEFGVRTCVGVLIPSQGPEDAVRSSAG